MDDLAGLQTHRVDRAAQSIHREISRFSIGRDRERVAAGNVGTAKSGLNVAVLAGSMTGEVAEAYTVDVAP